jgi:hydrogenase maturation protein HypF
MEIRRQIEVSGIVQGVGFRPYVYRLATNRRLNGSICNTSAGVTIEVQGPLEAVQDFVERLPAEAPPLARITNFAIHKIPCTGDTEFRIGHSERGEQVRTLISPDVAICPDCLRELFDPNDRRYGYPFINCTNCGPRFTIVNNIPYDRPYTSMAVFPMCPACQAEYDDPHNRRFHAQPNACWECGPQVELWNNHGKRIACPDPVAKAAEALHSGLILAVKGLGGFHLTADATKDSAVALLRQRKRRVEKPFAVMVPDVNAARELCELDRFEQAALECVQRPIVLLAKKTKDLLTDEVAPFNRYLGIFLPYTPLHYLLLRAGPFGALVMTSGNISEEPIAIGNHEAVSRLSGLADYFLVHNRDILLRCDDSVVRVTGGKIRQLRRSRGFVPVPVFLNKEQRSVLAVGGELKNTICLTSGRNAFLSQHVGDLENAESFQFFSEVMEHLQRILEIRPELVAYDLHPDYFSTKWALQQCGKVRVVGVQHHHAHIASCMAENRLEDNVIGFALDGTGYGTDGHIWGGEVLVARYQDFQRVAHFEYVPMPGGSAAIHEPWRMAVSYLVHHFGRDFLEMPIPFVRQLDPYKTDFVLQMIDRNLNSPYTSSCGRLFDALAALIGIRQTVNYEAQAAIELEMAVYGAEEGAYSLELVPDADRWIIKSRSLFERVIRDLERNTPAAVISARFHRALAQGLAEIAARIRERTGLTRVCLSGGTFHNQILSRDLESRLQSMGFEVFTHHEVPTGDGGLSLGQAMVAARMSEDNLDLRDRGTTGSPTHTFDESRGEGRTERPDI